MTTLYVGEFQGLASQAQNDTVAMVCEPPLREQVIANAGTTTPIPLQFLATTTVLEISTDSVCSIAFGVFGTVVATVANKRLAANERILVRITPGVVTGMAVVLNT